MTLPTQETTVIWADARAFDKAAEALTKHANDHWGWGAKQWNDVQEAARLVLETYLREARS